MILFLYGPDTYRSGQKLREIVKSYKKIHKSGLNLKYFEAKGLIFQDFRDELRASSMFSEKKLFVIKNIFSNSEFKGKFLKDAIFFQDSKDIILLYEGALSKNDFKNDLLFKFLKKNAKSQEFTMLGAQKLRNWLTKEFNDYGAKIDNEAMEKLINFVGSDLWRMSQEVKKLVNYKSKYQNTEILSEDVDILVKPKIDTNIFKTIDAIAARDKKFALKLLHQHLEKGDSPFYLFSMLNFQFRNLLLIKSQPVGNLSKKLGMHPYVIKKAVWQSEKFSLNGLKKIYQKIFQADLNIKTGKIDPQTALDLLITEI